MHLLIRIFAACSGSQLYAGANESCYSTNLPTVSASSSTLHTMLQIFFAILGALAVLFVVIGGLRYTASGGDPKSMQEAKNTILYAVVGLVVAILAEVIVTFVLGYVK